MEGELLLLLRRIEFQSGRRLDICDLQSSLGFWMLHR